MSQDYTLCGKCGGRGSIGITPSLTWPVENPCPRCKGSGRVLVNTSPPCRRCGGTGQIHDAIPGSYESIGMGHPCPACNSCLEDLRLLLG